MYPNFCSCLKQFRKLVVSSTIFFRGELFSTSGGYPNHMYSWNSKSSLNACLPTFSLWKFPFSICPYPSKILRKGIGIGEVLEETQRLGSTSLDMTTVAVEWTPVTGLPKVPKIQVQGCRFGDESESNPGFTNI